MITLDSNSNDVSSANHYIYRSDDSRDRHYQYNNDLQFSLNCLNEGERNNDIHQDAIFSFEQNINYLENFSSKILENNITKSDLKDFSENIIQTQDLPDNRIIIEENYICNPNKISNFIQNSYDDNIIENCNFSLNLSFENLNLEANDKRDSFNYLNESVCTYTSQVDGARKHGRSNGNYKYNEYMLYGNLWDNLQTGCVENDAENNLKFYLRNRKLVRVICYGKILKDKEKVILNCKDIRVLIIQLGDFNSYGKFGNIATLENGREIVRKLDRWKFKIHCIRHNRKKGKRIYSKRKRKKSSSLYKNK